MHGPTGHFTQEDPIGLAGGMNLYGFAGGDPVNYSDPFGLSPVGLFAKTVKQVFKRISREQAVESTDDVFVVGRSSSGDAKKLAKDKWGKKATRHDALAKEEIKKRQSTKQATDPEGKSRRGLGRRIMHA